MMMNMKDATPMRPAKREAAPEKPSGSYAALPDAVTGSPAYINLSDAAVRLLVEMVSHHDGWNNGILHTAYTALRTRGLGSQSKVERAFTELIEAGFILKTRNGGLNQGPDTYALTWLPPTSKDRAGNEKYMPLLPRPYPINKFLVTNIVRKEKTLKGAARNSRAARVAREIHGEDSRDVVSDVGLPIAHQSIPAQSTGNTVLLSMGGTVKQRKTTKTVPPKDTDCAAQRYGLSRPSLQSYAAHRYGVISYRPLHSALSGSRLISGASQCRRECFIRMEADDDTQPSRMPAKVTGTRKVASIHQPISENIRL